MRPRCDPFQNLLSHSFHLEPDPAGLSDGIDAEGNAFTVAWFTGPVRRLLLRAESEVDTLRVDPFHFLVTDPETLRLPVRYAEPLVRLCSEIHRKFSKVDRPTGRPARHHDP